MNQRIAQLRKLPQHKDETWQAALFRSPIWTQDDDGEPFRLWTALCISVRTGLLGIAELVPAKQRSPRLVLDAVSSLAGQQGGYRPGQIEVGSADVANALRAELADIGVEVIVQTSLPTLDVSRRELTEQMLEGRQDPNALDVSGVTLKHLRAFAQAASEFYAAAPWQHLANEDLIEVVAPKAERGFQWANVLGEGGEEFGIGFFESRAQYEQMLASEDPQEFDVGRGLWSFTYSELAEIPIGDADAWEDHALPVSGADAYPLLIWFGRDGVRRPTPRQWAFVEGLVRALARTTEAEMDSGRWTKTVETSAGSTEYRLTLPALLQSANAPVENVAGGMPDHRVMERNFVDMERATRGRDLTTEQEHQRFLNEQFADRPVARQPGQTPLEQAQDLVYAAVEVSGRRQLQLLRKALEISPDCADAYVLLAERTGDAGRMCALYAQGTEAGERALGPAMFAEHVGHFWGILATRPYMRARYGLAQCLEDRGDLDDAVGHYQELIRLSPVDNLGVRYRLAGCLLHAESWEPLETLLRQFDEPSAHWLFLKALASFAMAGDTAQSRERLAAAHQANSRVRPYLLGDADLPYDLPAVFQPGSDNEAIIVAAEMFDDWDQTPDALDWLRANTPAAPRKRPRRKK